MPDTTRLVAKIDEAHRALKCERRRGMNDGSRLAEALREKFTVGRPFEIRIGGITETIRCDDVRVSKTTISLPTKLCDGTIPLMRVTICRHGETADGEEILGFGVYEDDDSVTPVSLL